MGYKVGIDLGTTFSAVAYIEPDTGIPKIVKNKFNQSVTPSVIAFNENGRILVGQEAKNEKAMGNPDTASFFKRSMGMDNCEVEYFGKVYTPGDLSAILLRYLVEEAEKRLGDTIDDVVITVPAYFTSRERKETLIAGEKAGLRVTSIISEPSAAAFAYGLNHYEEKNVLIYDLGGGTFDVSIANITSERIEIAGTAGESRLGGKDWDMAIVHWLENKFYDEFDEKIDEDIETISEVMELAEKAKKELTVKESTIIRFKQGSCRGEYSLSRKEFNDITKYMLNTTKSIIEDLFRDVEKKNGISYGWDNIDEVILAGGSTKMKMIEEFIEENLHKKPLNGINPDEAVAIGAAIMANIDKNGNVLDGTIKSGRTRKTRLELGSRMITDVIAHSLGMIAENAAGDKYVNSIIIEKNSSIPITNSKKHKLYTGKGENNELEVYLLQGEMQEPEKCELAGKYVFHDISHVENGAIIDVSYTYNSNGIIDVKAKQGTRELTMTKESLPKDMSWIEKPPHHKKISEPMDIYMIIDLSVSMSAVIEDVKQKVHEFACDLLKNKNNRVGIIGVADRVKVYTRCVDDMAYLNSILNDISICDVGISNEAHPFDCLYESVNNNIEAGKSIGVVLADGMWSNESVAVRAAKKCNAHGIDTVAIGFGSADIAFLRKISSIKELSEIKDLGHLSESFSKIATVINDRLIM